MNPLTQEWVQKAEGDYAAAQLLVQANAARHADAVCFHAQQCVEKYLKAWLQDAGMPFRKRHDLEELLAMASQAMPSWSVWQPDLLVLTTHAVDFRYPGRTASLPDAQFAVQVCERVR